MNTFFSKLVTMKFWIKIISLIILLIVGFEFVSYGLMKPAIRVAKIETLKHPFSERIVADDSYLEFFPLGSDKDVVIDILRQAGFSGLTGRKKVDGVDNKESYWGMTKFPAGALGTIMFLLWEVQVTVVFVDGKLTSLESYIFLKGI